MSNREQDVKIAELMGWKRLSIHSWRSPEDGHKYLPKFSSDISLAMQVIEWMRKEREFFITIVPQMDGYLLTALDYQPIGNYYAHLCNSRADTFKELPDAICHIILETVEMKFIQIFYFVGKTMRNKTS